MTNKEIKNIIEQILNAEDQNGRYGNGNECTFKRMYIGDNEYTLVDGKLYAGVKYFDGEKETYSTVTRIKEGRREDSLAINGYAAKFAGMIANNIKSADDFFKTC